MYTALLRAKERLCAVESAPLRGQPQSETQYSCCHHGPQLPKMGRFNGAGLTSIASCRAGNGLPLQHTQVTAVLTQLLLTCYEQQKLLSYFSP